MVTSAEWAAVATDADVTETETVTVTAIVDAAAADNKTNEFKSGRGKRTVRKFNII